MEEETRFEALRQQCSALSPTQAIPRELGSSLVEFLLGKEPYFRRRAALLLGAFGPRASLAVEALQSVLLLEKEEATLCALLSALETIGADAAPAIPTLVMLLTQKETPERVRQHAALALGGIGIAAQEYTPLLLERFLLEASRYPWRRLTQSLYLTGVCGLGVLSEAVARYEESASPVARLALLWAIIQIARRNPEVAPETRRRLLGGARLASPQERRLSVKGLGLLTHEEDLPLLIEALGDPAEPVRIQAARSLSRLGVKGLQTALGLLGDFPNESVLFWATKRGIQEVAQDPATSEEALRLLLPEAYLWGVFVAKNPGAPPMLLEKLYRDQLLSTDAKVAIAQHPQTPKLLLHQMLSSESEWVVAAVAQNPNLSVAFSKGFSLQVAQELARSPRCSPLVLQKFSRTARLREEVAQNPSTPQDTLQELIQTNDEAMKKCVAQNPSAPFSFLQSFAFRERGEGQRQAAAQNPNTPLRSLQRLAKDPLAKVRQGVVQNPSAPSYLIKEILQGERYAAIQEGAAQNPNAEEALLTHLSKIVSGEVRVWVAKHPNTPTQILEDLESSREEAVLRALAQNPNAPLSLLERLAQHYEPSVRASVVQNPNAPTELLERLSSDSIPYVRSAVAKNEGTPLETLLQLTRDEEEESKREALKTLNGERNARESPAKKG